MVNGVSSCGQPGVYGTLEMPATGHTPGGRETAIGWTESSGNLWLFGGSGFDANGSFGSLGDLWQFSPSTNEWTWMGGSSTPGDIGQPGVYGTLGKPAAGNFPGSRYYVASWADSSGDFWLFGGLGQDANNTGGSLNDLWKFQPAGALTSPAPGSTFTGSSAVSYTHLIRILPSERGKWPGFLRHIFESPQESFVQQSDLIVLQIGDIRTLAPNARHENQTTI